MVTSDPHACSTAHPDIIRAYHATKNGALWNADMVSVCETAQAVRRTLGAQSGGAKIFEAFSGLPSEAERLLVMGTSGPGCKRGICRRPAEQAQLTVGIHEGPRGHI